MMLKKLQSVFACESAPLIRTNPEYHFSVHELRPAGRSFSLLVTNGLSEYRQPVTGKFGSYERIELYICLPEYWDIEKKNWPVEWLDRIARVPGKNETWFGPGDTLPAGNPVQEIDPVLKAGYFILSPPILLADEMAAATVGDTPVQMLAVIPIFRKEFEFKMQNSATVLFQKLQAKNITEMIDLYREPVARKRFMGMF